ncbi:MAG: type II toxin-antitoxin system prevent-host-death family antitoxin [Rhizobiales bacterium]|nr:type II toxin-antitoxin system prevent-host-death family antitoxin [Hyphomicrobiales bacterium]
MTTVNVHKAKTQLSKLIAMAERGEEVVIARGNAPVVRLVPINPKRKSKVRLGLLAGKIDTGPGFFEPLPDSELEAWGIK